MVATTLIRHFNHNTTRGDKLIAFIALVLLFTIYWMFWIQSGLSGQAAIYVNGKYWSKVDLYQSQQLEIEGNLGVSVLQIENGKIRFIESPCDNKLCIHQGWINVGGESAICLPNGISVHVLSPDPRYDSINF